MGYLYAELLDRELRELRRVAVRLAVTLTALLVEDDDLLTTDMALDRSTDGGLAAHSYLTASIRRHEDILDIDRLTDLGICLVRDAKRLGCAVDLKLLSCDLNDGEHRKPLFLK